MRESRRDEDQPEAEADPRERNDSRVCAANADELNEALRQFVLDDRRKHPGEVASNQGRWHSLSDLLRRMGSPHAPRLEQMFFEGVRAAISAMGE